MSTFVDTNVFVYARDVSRPDKQMSAERWVDRLWQTAGGRLSVQVLNEFYVTVTRKLDPGMAPADARSDVHDLLAWEPLPVDGGLVVRAWTIEDRYGLSFWDALIVAAAIESDCQHLLTEDLQDGQHLDGVIVVNPFVHPPDSIL